jgi:hypothetical protein
MALDTHQIVDYLWTPFEDGTASQVYHIVDAARDKSILAELMAAKEEKVCLFRGEKAVEMAQVAPYLVKLDRGQGFTQWLINKGWGNSWGIFMVSRLNFVKLEIHCRDLFQVYDEEGRPLLFRYYDPRVLRVYLPTCNSQELKLFFGPVNHIVLEDDDSSGLLRYQNLEGKLQIQKKR